MQEIRDKQFDQMTVQIENLVMSEKTRQSLLSMVENNMKQTTDRTHNQISAAIANARMQTQRLSVT